MKTPVKQNGTTGENSGKTIDGHINKKQKILEKITYEDLEDTNDKNKTSTAHLNLSKVK